MVHEMEKKEKFEGWGIYQIEYKTRLVFKDSGEPVTTDDDKEYCFFKTDTVHAVGMENIPLEFETDLTINPPSELLSFVESQGETTCFEGRRFAFETTITKIYQDYQLMIYPCDGIQYKPTINDITD